MRAEVPDAVAVCKRAGITVRMVTGDNTYTAQHIARECGILTDGIALEGPDFRKRSDEELKEILPTVQVGDPPLGRLTRSSGLENHKLWQGRDRLLSLLRVHRANKPLRPVCRACCSQLEVDERLRDLAAGQCSSGVTGKRTCAAQPTEQHAAICSPLLSAAVAPLRRC